MSFLSLNQAEDVRQRSSAKIGIYGHMTIFLWLLALVMLAPMDRVMLTAVICLGVGIAFYPQSFRRVMNLRFFFLCALLILPPILWLGSTDKVFFGIPISSDGLQLAKQILLRAVVVVIAIDGLTSSVEISSIARIFERGGLTGLGFTIGIALNLLPTLRQSTQNTWRSLQMRGGIRRRGLRAVQLFGVTVITNAIRWAEEIAMAAEARAFSPGRSSAMLIKRGSLDWLILFGGLLTLIASLLIM